VRKASTIEALSIPDRNSALATYGPGNDHPMIEKLKRFVSGAGVPPAVQAEIVAELYPRSFRIGTSILTSTVTGSVLAAIMHSWLPLAWMAVALVLCGLRTLDWVCYQRARDSHTPSEWAVRFILGFAPFGIWWGVAAAVLFLSDDALLMAIASVGGGDKTVTVKAGSLLKSDDGGVIGVGFPASKTPLQTGYVAGFKMVNPM
jgi:hypothetical protein